jgi:hypothetical protein
MDYTTLSTKDKIKVQLDNLRNYENMDYTGLRTLKIIENLLDELKEDLPK